MAEKSSATRAARAKKVRAYLNNVLAMDPISDAWQMVDQRFRFCGLAAESPAEPGKPRDGDQKSKRPTGFHGTRPRDAGGSGRNVASRIETRDWLFPGQVGFLGSVGLAAGGDDVELVIESDHDRSLLCVGGCRDFAEQICAFPKKHSADDRSVLAQ